jgi:hypothetical protein
MSKADQGELPGSWRQIHGAVWLIGLAIIAWQGWWWPGILVLVAISGLVQAAISLYLNRQSEQKTLVEQRERRLPAFCPNCGGPIDAAKVRWSAPLTAICPFCGSSIKAFDETQLRTTQESGG